MNRSLFFRPLIMLLLSISALSLHSQTIPDTALLHLTVPDTFQAVFVTTKGEITIEAYRDWSPQGADRLYQLIKSGFYTDNCIFRVQPEYVVQFGISDSSEANFFWDKRPIADEPVKGSNLKGVISYARDGARQCLLGEEVSGDGLHYQGTNTAMRKRIYNLQFKI